MQAFLSPVAEYLKTLLENDVALGFKEVYYGDQDLIRHSPTACVAPAQQTRTLTETGLHVNNDMVIYILIYGGQLGDMQGNSLDTDKLTEETVVAIDKDSVPAVYGGTQLGGNVIEGSCDGIEYGYAIRGNKLIRSNRIIWSGLTKTGLVP